MPCGLSACRISPSFITTMWSASAIASFWSCVTNTVVVLSRSWSLRSSTHISSRNSASSVPSGSSIRKALGLRTMARPSATRCRSPPDSPSMRESSRCSMRRMAAVSRTRRSISARGNAFVAQRELEVAAHAHVRIEREQLEHHRDVALARPQVGHVLVVQRDRAARWGIPGRRSCAAWSSCRSPKGPAARRTFRLSSTSEESRTAVKSAKRLCRFWIRISDMSARGSFPAME